MNIKEQGTSTAEEQKGKPPHRASQQGVSRGRSNFSGDAATVYVSATFNNTKLTATDHLGRTLCWYSAGRAGMKGARKSTPHAAQKAGEGLGKMLLDRGIRRVEVLMRGFGPGRESVLTALKGVGMHIVAIGDRTPVPHNGCRPPKARRN